MSLINSNSNSQSHSNAPLKLAILVSGQGSNLEAILKAIEAGKLSAQVKFIISNRPNIKALEIARTYKVEPLVIPHTGLSRHEHERKILDVLLSNKSVDYIVLAGYMRVLSPYFLQQFHSPSGHSRVLNIHPSLLPAFPGINAYEDAFSYGVKVSGITVHLVDEEVDHGPILAQECFPRLPGDTLEDFKRRGLTVEHRLYPTVIQEIFENQEIIFARKIVARKGE